MNLVKQSMRRFFLCFLSVLMITVSGNILTVSAAATDKENGWVKESSGEVYYYKNGEIVKNKLLTLGNNIYYVDKKGRRYSGWRNIREKTYYFREDGKAYKGWMSMNNTWYYFNEQSGYMQKDILLVSGSGKVYIFDKEGKLCKGWCQYKGKSYYMGSNGYALKGVYKINGKYYCFDAKTAYLYKDKVVTMTSGNIYYFDKKGIRFNKGWKNIRNNGKMGTYYFKTNGAACKGWLKKDGKWYYFDKKTGIMYKNKTVTTSTGKKYIFNSKGVCTNKK